MKPARTRVHRAVPLKKRALFPGFHVIGRSLRRVLCCGRIFALVGALLMWVGPRNALARRAASVQPKVLLGAHLVCPARVGSGRVVCELTMSASEGQVITWADALVVEAPEFALPLRARVAASLPEEGAPRAVVALPLFAKAENTGMLKVRARAVTCPAEGPGECRSAFREVRAHVAVTRKDPDSARKLAGRAAE